MVFHRADDVRRHDDDDDSRTDKSRTDESRVRAFVALTTIIHTHAHTHTHNAHGPTHETTYFARNFISFTPVSVTFLFTARVLSVKYYATSVRGPEADDRMIYDPRMRAQKRRRVSSSFIWRPGERRRRSLLTKSFRSAFRFKRRDCGNNGRIHKSRYKSFFHVSGRSTNLAQCTVTLAEINVEARLREKEIVNTCAHVCKRDKRKWRDKETTRW